MQKLWKDMKPGSQGMSHCTTVSGCAWSCMAVANEGLDVLGVPVPFPAFFWHVVVAQCLSDKDTTRHNWKTAGHSGTTKQPSNKTAGQERIVHTLGE